MTCIGKQFFSSLDGLTAVVEEMDFREHEEDFRQPGNLSYKASSINVTVGCNFLSRMWFKRASRPNKGHDNY